MSLVPPVIWGDLDQAWACRVRRKKGQGPNGYRSAGAALVQAGLSMGCPPNSAHSHFHSWVTLPFIVRLCTLPCAGVTSGHDPILHSSDRITRKRKKRPTRQQPILILSLCRTGTTTTGSGRLRCRQHLGNHKPTEPTFATGVGGAQGILIGFSALA